MLERRKVGASGGDWLRLLTVLTVSHLGTFAGSHTLLTVLTVPRVRVFWLIEKYF